MQVDERTAAGSSVFDGKSYFFCGAGCKKKFDANPAAYVAAPAASGGMERPPHSSHEAKLAPPSPSGVYTCPMHPQIQQAGPGSCPLCGMALEPLMPTAEGDDTELRKVTLRFWISLALTIPVVVIAMWHVPGMRWVETLLATPVVLWGCGPYFARGWSGARAGHPNMYTLIGLGVGVAYGYSLIATSRAWPLSPRRSARRCITRRLQ
jgi:Cu+-exporting ATPase